MEEERIQITYKPLLGPKEITKQRKYACKLKLPELETVPPHNKKVAIVASGPSLKEYLKDLKNFDGDIIAINKENQHLQDEGIKFQKVVVIDPLILPQYLGKPLTDVTYYFASNCSPELFRAYKDYNVILFHIFSDGVVYPKNKKHMIVGSIAGLAAIRVAKHLGYRDIHIYGMDCSWEDDNQIKVYEDKTKTSYNNNILIVEANGKKFKTSIGLIGAAEDFCKYYLANTNNAKITVYGDTFLGNLMDQLDKRYKKGKYYNVLEVA
jgi:hypothetical protein